MASSDPPENPVFCTWLPIAHPSHAGRGEYSGSVLVSDVPDPDNCVAPVVARYRLTILAQHMVRFLVVLALQQRRKRHLDVSD
jgi:non-ribosomal peptide synthetase component E (peptide arylation enzyme)